MWVTGVGVENGGVGGDGGGFVGVPRLCCKILGIFVEPGPTWSFMNHCPPHLMVCLCGGRRVVHDGSHSQERVEYVAQAQPRLILGVFCWQPQPSYVAVKGWQILSADARSRGRTSAAAGTNVAVWSQRTRCSCDSQTSVPSFVCRCPNDL